VVLYFFFSTSNVTQNFVMLTGDLRVRSGVQWSPLC